jgi:hypothetical protein
MMNVALDIHYFLSLKDLESDSMSMLQHSLNGGKLNIDVKPSVTITIINVHLEEPKEGE